MLEKTKIDGLNIIDSLIHEVFQTTLAMRQTVGVPFTFVFQSDNLSWFHSWLFFSVFRTIKNLFYYPRQFYRVVVAIIDAAVAILVAVNRLRQVQRL